MARSPVQLLSGTLVLSFKNFLFDSRWFSSLQNYTLPIYNNVHINQTRRRGIFCTDARPRRPFYVLSFGLLLNILYILSYSNSTHTSPRENASSSLGTHSLSELGYRSSITLFKGMRFFFNFYFLSYRVLNPCTFLRGKKTNTI